MKSFRSDPKCTHAALHTFPISGSGLLLFRSPARKCIEFIEFPRSAIPFANICVVFFRFSFFSTFLHSRYGEHAVLHCGANNLETFPIFRSQFRPGVLKTCWWRRASRAFISFHFIFCMRAFTIFSIFRRFPSTQKHNTHIGSTQIESGFIRGEQTMRGRPLGFFFSRQVMMECHQIFILW